MKQAKSIPQQNFTSHHQKFTENLIKKKPKKQFELLYRERDQTTQENPIESIIFVKSKTCKSKQTNKKIKVQQEFNKIMKDLDAHLIQHKKNKSTQKKSYSPNSSQLKATSLSKKQTKQSDFTSKKNKTTEKDFTKIFKNANKGNEILMKQKIQKVEFNKSPSKANRTHISPNSKRVVSPKSPKFEKQNILSKGFHQSKANQFKSPNSKKSNRKVYAPVTQSDQSFNQLKEDRKTDIKRNIRPIPLKVEQYIFLEDNFQLIKQKSLYKLQTKLLSTYRNNSKQFGNKLGLKQKSGKNQIISQHFEVPEVRENYLDYFADEPSVISEEEKSEFNLQSQREIKDFQLTNPKIIDQILRKIIHIQKWWKKTLKIQHIKNYLHSIDQKRNQFLDVQTEKNTTTPANLPSVKSITFNEESQINQNQQNEEMNLLKDQNEIVKQKRDMHSKILQNLLKDNKITKDQFEVKMQIAEKQYEKQLKEIMTLYKLCQGQSQLSKDQEFKIIQGKKVTSQLVQTEQRKEQDSQEENNDVNVKIYKIGDKITSEMQSYIQNAKKNKNVSSQNNNKQFVSDKYSKKIDLQGEEYYEDFQSEQSNEVSPHKILQPTNFSEFEANIETTNNNGGFEPNTNFMQMLEQYKEQQEIKNRMQQRIGIQMGAIKLQNPDQNSIDTTILGIHQFLVNFFKFYLCNFMFEYADYYKDEFLRFINMPYGYQPEKRLKFIQGYEDQTEDLTQDDDGIIYGLEYIISDDVFEEFIQQYYGPSLRQATEKQKAVIKCSQIHDRAVFECFNEALNHFRPYYSIGGPPYIWNCSQKTLTFYFIAQENIQEVFEKTEFRVMKWASALLGLHVPDCEKLSTNSNKNLIGNKNLKQQKIENIVENTQLKCHPMIAQNQEQRLIKQERLEITDSIAKWSEIQEQKTSTLYELSSMILEELAGEFGTQFLNKLL